MDKHGEKSKIFESKADKKEKDLGKDKPRDDGVDLENQFILRLPEETAKVLHEALNTGALKDRMTIRMDNDLRYGEVRLDNWLLHAKIVDLPTVIECLKTIDNKSFYKSADICQLVICKEEPDALDNEKESPKNKKKDPNKVDKKYLWPHGITPPCKNIRKRRFRKTLKKKNVDAPEIEKEVKRLFREDNEAIRVTYEILNEDPGARSADNNSKEFNEGDDEYNDTTTNDNEKDNNDSGSQKYVNVDSDEFDNTIDRGDIEKAEPRASGGAVAEHELFGEELSSSDDDETHNNSRLRDMEDTSRLSADDSHLTDFDGSNIGAGVGESINKNVFNKDMFTNSPKGDDNINLTESVGGSGLRDYDDDLSNDITTATPHLNVDDMQRKIVELRHQYDVLQDLKNQKTQEIGSIQNPTLKMRMQETVDNLLSKMVEKSMQIKELENMISFEKDN